MRRESFFCIKSFIHLFIIGCHFAGVTLNPAMGKLHVNNDNQRALKSTQDKQFALFLSHLAIISLSPVLMDKALLICSRRVFSSSFILIVISLRLYEKNCGLKLEIVALHRPPLTGLAALQC